MTHTTPADPLAPTRERVVQLLSLADPNGIAHNVEPYGQGLRVTLTRSEPHPTMYAYALPWARGWTVFVSDEANATNHDWHHAATGYSCGVPNERGVVGPENVNADKLADKFIDAIDYMVFHYDTDLYLDVHTDYESCDLTDGSIECSGDCEDECDCDDITDGGPDDCVFYGL